MARVAPGGALKTQTEQSDGFSKGKTHVSVTRPEGFLLRVEVLSKIDLPPTNVFDILCDSENGKVFRNHQVTK